ncbi:DUF6541 family protein [Agromyces mediolanus]|uniref:DUF6541 family protein n=1 Tax=Agromyces mediolanus TaxID=41986 RepID=UPI00166618ED|nr:DUF6541 family protein [Agromyces mediolanus]
MHGNEGRTRAYPAGSAGSGRRTPSSRRSATFGVVTATRLRYSYRPNAVAAEIPDEKETADVAEWLAIVPAVLVSVLVLGVPGALVAAALGLRGIAFAGFVPAAGVSVVAVTSLAGHVIGFKWGVLPVAAVTAVLALAAYAARRIWISRSGAAPTKPAGAGWAVPTAAVVAAVLLTARFTVMVGQPGDVSQTFDNIFHLNAVQYIVETGDASPLRLGSLTYAFDGAGSFYPAAWHAITALVVQLTGATIPVAVNAVNLVIVAAVWPLGVLLLTRVVLGANRFGLLAAGVLAAGFAAFPYLMLDFGVLYPNVLSIALLPAALAFVVASCRLDDAVPMSVPAAWLGLAATLPGLSLAHPSTLMALIAFSAAPVGVAVFRHYRRLRAEHAAAWRYVLTSVILVVGVAAAAVLLIKARPTSEAAFWGPRESFLRSVFAGFTNSTVGYPVDLVITGLTIAGLWAIWRRKNQRWLLLSYLFAVGLYVISAGLPASYFRYGLTGTWYNDSNRLASLIPVLALPIAAAGAAWLVTTVLALIARRNTARGFRIAVPAAAAALLVLGTQWSAPMAEATENAEASYAMTDESLLLSTDELELLEEIRGELPEDSVVVGSPWTGTSLVYAISGYRALMPAIYGDRDQDVQLIMDGLRDADARPEVCSALKRENAWYILDFGPQEVHGGTHIFVGFEDLEDSDAVELVDEVGAARLYRVTACG